ncbi:response regulator [Tessaracoccus lubricantis]|uniref:Response regulator n=1 Tax=Tessaracoccus lubricantis TaxID=545543 RepID=A0ABP9EXU9_9ACTN
MSPTVLVVEDDADVRSLIEFSLRLDGVWTVQAAASVADALVALEAGDGIDIVLTDGQLGDGTSETVRAAAAPRPVVLLSAWADGPSASRVPETGYAARMAKPFDPLALSAVLTAALEGASGAPDGEG